MVLFPYRKGRFLRDVVDRVLASERSSTKTALGGPDDMEALARWASERQSARLLAGDRDHFIADWLRPEGQGCRAFDRIPPDRIARVLKEGFRRAILAAEDPRYGGLPASPLPISVVWLCNAEPTVFEVVTAVARGVHVQVLIVTPAPRLGAPEQTGEPDDVLVTRFFSSREEIDEVKDRLRRAGDLDPTIEDPQGRKTVPGEVGTFDVWT